MAGPADPLTIARAVSAGSGLGRIGIGVALAASPRFALRTLGFGEPSATTIAVSRLAGGRDIVIGAQMLAALDEPGRLRMATLAAAAVDAGDALTFAASLGEEETRQAALRGLAAAVTAALAGLWVAQRLR